ncbi:acyl-CoA carboxylase subunit epsilon [Sphaerisporangium album]|uniref:Acyl-CoA carboxylase subunit epsilon n=1 Tax=Sphaerisporangium album TaxID=509200 RepID=A0A367FBY9_9ACTN|nr:acyl-CoA carboxylase subunit epsilon [Sphaerisporangium album]
MAQSYLRVVHGAATPEEVAALVIAVATRAATPPRPAQKPALWRNPAHQMRTALSPGSGAWRASSRPH